MNFNKAATPFVKTKLQDYRQAIARGENEKAFRCLEDAHVIGQQSTYLHCLTHYQMLKHGIAQNDAKEVFGQIFRFVGALTKTATGFIPVGNTGGANVSPFKSLPISDENQKILEKINHAQS